MFFFSSFASMINSERDRQIPRDFRLRYTVHFMMGYFGGCMG